MTVIPHPEERNAMARQTLTALFDRYEDAAETVRRLEAAGVPPALFEVEAESLHGAEEILGGVVNGGAVGMDCRDRPGFASCGDEGDGCGGLVRVEDE